MPLLPYCILLTRPGVEFPQRGVQDAAVCKMEVDPLLALYSEIDQSSLSPDSFKNDALAFHKVVHGIFDQIALVPFRFPTWLTPAELKAHLAEKSADYQRFLTSHANDVQMELRVEAAAASSMGAATTGTQHLRQRAEMRRALRQRADDLKHLLGGHTMEWREREIPDGVRLFALIERERVAEFREKLSLRNSDVRCSGPWPATEFLELATL